MLNTITIMSIAIILIIIKIINEYYYNNEYCYNTNYCENNYPVLL